ncbi:MAG: porin family protein [Aequorivita antarctica]
MKKLLLFVALATLSFTAVQSQNVRFGIKAGVNFSSTNGDDFDGADGVTGLQAGAVAKIGFTELLALQPEILFSAQGYAVDDVTVRLGYINVPIMADFTIVEGLSLQGGPQFGFNVVSGYKVDGDEYEHFEDDDNFETLDLGVGIGAQYVLPMNLFFQARYVVGFSDVVKDYDGKNAVLSFSAGYFFN